MELLVVVCVIVILLSLLLPSLGRARDIAKSTVCQSNLRQDYYCITDYAVDYEGWPPNVDYSNPLRFSGTRTYSVLVQRGLAKPELTFCCPTASDAERQAVITSSAVGYIYMCGLSYDFGIFKWAGKYTGYANLARKVQDFNLNIPIMADICSANRLGTALPYAGQVHSWSAFPHYGIDKVTGSNLLSGDGSVSFNSPSQMELGYSYYTATDLYW